MKHLKRLLALCLCLLLVFEIAGPGVNSLKKPFSLIAGAESPTTWPSGSSSFNIQQRLNDLNKGTPGKAPRFVSLKVGSVNHVEHAEDVCSFDQWKTVVTTFRDWYKTAPDAQGIRLDGDIGYNYDDDGADDLWNYYAFVDKEKTWSTGSGCDEEWHSLSDDDKNYRGPIEITHSMVLDLNGHKFVTKYERKDTPEEEFVMFKVKGIGTTLIIIDSSPDQTGLLQFRGKFFDVETNYQSHQTRNLIKVEEGATVYVMNGNLAAGGMTLENMETKKMKFLRIAGSLLRTALSLGSAALSVYSSVMTGGLGGGGGSALKTVSNLIDVGSGVLDNLSSDAQKAESSEGAQDPNVQNPQGGSLEADREDVNGRNNGALELQDDKNTNTNATAGQGGTIGEDVIGVCVVTEKDPVPVEGKPTPEGKVWLYKSAVAAVGERARTEPLKWGDEVYVTKETKAGSGWYICPEGDHNLYIQSKYVTKRDDYKGEELPANRVTLENSMQYKANQEAQKKKNDAKVKGFQGLVNKIGEAWDSSKDEIVKAKEDIVDTIGQMMTAKGKFYQITWGSVFTVDDGGTLVVFDGTFSGFGQDGDHRKNVIQGSGDVYIFGGKFHAIGGANMFQPGMKDKLRIRGGDFDCSSVSLIRGTGEENKVEKIAGTKGTINAEIESFGRDLIADGRIQIRENAGLGNLVVRDANGGDKIVYSLYCKEESLPDLTHISVKAKQSEYLGDGFKLISSHQNDDMLDGCGAINWRIGDQSEYLALNCSGKDTSSIIMNVDASNAEAVNRAFSETCSWYYKFPVTDFLSSFRGEYKEGDTYYNFPYVSELDVYQFRLYKVDPVTLENIGQPLVTKTLDSATLLLGQIRLVPGPGATENDKYLMEADKWEPNAIYRVTLSIQEYLKIGKTGVLQTFGPEDGRQLEGKTSMLIRTTSYDKEIFTPVSFSNAKVLNSAYDGDKTVYRGTYGVGDTAQVTFTNAQVGRIDIYGEKVFSVKYDWRVEGYDDVHLVVTTRDELFTGGGEYKINGRVYDQHRLRYGARETVAGVEKTVLPQPTTYLGRVNDSNLPESTKPYFSSSDTLVIPASIPYKNGTLSLIGKKIYCEVTYGICYNKWVRAFKYLPVLDYRPEAGDTATKRAILTANNGFADKIPDLFTERETVRDSIVEKTVRTSSFLIRSAATGATPSTGRDYPDLDVIPPKHVYMDKNDPNAYTVRGVPSVPTDIPRYQEMLERCNAVAPYPKDTLEYLQTHLLRFSEFDNNQTYKDNIAKAKELSKNGLCIPTVEVEAFFYRYNEATDKWIQVTGGLDSVNARDPQFQGQMIACRLDAMYQVYRFGSLYTPLTETTHHGVWLTPVHVHEVDPIVKFPGRKGEILLFNEDQTINGDLELSGWTYDYINQKLTLKDYKMEIPYDSWPEDYRDLWRPCQQEEFYLQSYWTNHYNDRKFCDYQCYFWFADDVTIELQGNNQIRDYMHRDYNTANRYVGIKAKNLTFTGDGKLYMGFYRLDKGLDDGYNDYLTTFHGLEADSVTLNSKSVDLTLQVYGNQYKKNDMPENTVMIYTDALKLNEGKLTLKGPGLYAEGNDDATGYFVDWKAASEFVIPDITMVGGASTPEIELNSNILFDIYAADGGFNPTWDNKDRRHFPYWQRNSRTTEELKAVLTGKMDRYDYRFNTHVHTWDEGTITWATATEGGKIVFKCTDPACTGTKTESCDPLYSHLNLAQPTVDGVELYWSTHRMADGYEIYRADAKDGPFTKIATVDGKDNNTYTDAANLTPGQTYSYKVRAVRRAEPAANGKDSNVQSVALPNGVTVTNGKADKKYPAAGATVTITANAAPAGKAFDKWQVVKGGVTLADATKATTTFKMGTENVEITAIFKDLPAAAHSVKVNSGVADPAAAVKGATVKITANAAPAGKVFDKWQVVKGGVTLADATKATTTFVMGDQDVEVTATYKDAGGTVDFMLGDVDADGKVSSSDARLALRQAVDLENYAASSAEFKACDVDLSGTVTSGDARLILRRAVGFTDPEWGVKAN